MCGSSFDSYNSYGVGYNSCNTSSNSYNSNSASPLYGDQNLSHPGLSIGVPYRPNQTYLSQQSLKMPISINLESINSSSHSNNHSSASEVTAIDKYSANSSNYNSNYDTGIYGNNSTSYDASYENIARKTVESHKKMHKDDTLLPKVRSESLIHVSMYLAQKQRELSSANSNLQQCLLRSNNNIVANDKEEFY